MKKSKQGAPDSARLSGPVGTDPAEVMNNRPGVMNSLPRARTRVVVVGQPCSPILWGHPVGVATADKGGSRHGRRGGAMMRRADYNLTRMSGMLDLSKDAKVTCTAKAWTGRGQGAFRS